MESINDIISLLSKEEKSVLTDIIDYGFDYESNMDFLGDDGRIENVSAYGYNIDNIYNHRHFKEANNALKSLCNKLCPIDNDSYHIGRYVTYYPNYITKGYNLLFIREDVDDDFQKCCPL